MKLMHVDGVTVLFEADCTTCKELVEKAVAVCRLAEYRLAEYRLAVCQY